jgi:hypothetical protein
MTMRASGGLKMASLPTALLALWLTALALPGCSLLADGNGGAINIAYPALADRVTGHWQLTSGEGRRELRLYSEAGDRSFLDRWERERELGEMQTFSRGLAADEFGVLVPWLVSLRDDGSMWLWTEYDVLREFEPRRLLLSPAERSQDDLLVLSKDGRTAATYARAPAAMYVDGEPVSRVDWSDAKHATQGWAVGLYNQAAYRLGIGFPAGRESFEAAEEGGRLAFSTEAVRAGFYALVDSGNKHVLGEPTAWLISIGAIDVSTP